MDASTGQLHADDETFLCTGCVARGVWRRDALLIAALQKFNTRSSLQNNQPATSTMHSDNTEENVNIKRQRSEFRSTSSRFRVLLSHRKLAATKSHNRT